MRKHRAYLKVIFSINFYSGYSEMNAVPIFFLGIFITKFTSEY